MKTCVVGGLSDKVGGGDKRSEERRAERKVLLEARVAKRRAVWAG